MKNLNEDYFFKSDVDSESSGDSKADTEPDSDSESETELDMTEAGVSPTLPRNRPNKLNKFFLQNNFF